MKKTNFHIEFLTRQCIWELLKKLPEKCKWQPKKWPGKMQIYWRAFPLASRVSFGWLVALNSRI
jgi:hypothetical protein